MRNHVQFYFIRFVTIFKSFIVYVNEEGNEVAEASVDVALTYIKKNNKLGINAEVTKVSGNRTDSTGLLESCKLILLLSNMIIL